MLALELQLFEFSTRAFVPLAVAASVAGGVLRARLAQMGHERTQPGWHLPRPSPRRARDSSVDVA